MFIPLKRDLVLIGGGHTHALVLRKWGMAPMPGVRLTLINPGPTAPYTGMLPGHVAGHYARDELEIDLVRLARFADARLIFGHAIGIDRSNSEIEVISTGGASMRLGYDIASFDIGITSRMPMLDGFEEHAVAAKPLDTFAAAWRDVVEEARSTGTSPDIAVIGGGVAGAELSMAMAYALRELGQSPKVTMIETARQMSGVTERTQQHLERAMRALGVTARYGETVSRVSANSVMTEAGDEIPSAFTVGAAGAFPHTWLQETDLPLEKGFIRVGADLGVKGDARLFATGDCAHLTHAPRPKAGVFAVRAAPVLFDNLCAALSNQKRRKFRPQADYLKLISLGRKSAVAEKHGIALSGDWIWRLKNRIDRDFMDKLTKLPEMVSDTPELAAEGVSEILSSKPLCGGCGAKISGDILSAELAALPRQERDDILSQPGDDAAVLRVGGATQVITTDHLRAFTNDPALMARIAAVHALGDIWAMGAEPQSALASIILPRMSNTLQARTFREMMLAASEVFAKEGAAIVGGHSTMGAELTVGFTVTGLCAKKPIGLSGAKEGDALILTRPIGSGTILAAEMMGKARGMDVMNLLNALSKPQGNAARLLSAAHAMTDVTGFGLAGHLMNICAASEVGAVIWPEAVPIFEGALDLAAEGHHSSLYSSNKEAAPVIGASGPIGRLLHDPQTAGGLLAAVDGASVEDLLKELSEKSIAAVQIGEIVQGPSVIVCEPRTR